MTESMIAGMFVGMGFFTLFLLMLASTPHSWETLDME